MKTKTFIYKLWLTGSLILLFLNVISPGECLIAGSILTGFYFNKT